MLDLQSHSTLSDGELPPAGVVEAAAEAGVTPDVHAATNANAAKILAKTLDSTEPLLRR